jgi:ABC-type Fe3+/spermidine/putrescine transport system ATPase subunit
MLDVRGIQVSFGNLNVLRGIDLSVAQGEIVCLLGPSGCGKTTLLRVIAGLETPDSGDVLLEGQSIVSVPVHQRGFGLMFQDFALFPHLNVGDNIAFGLKMVGLSVPQRKRRVQEVLELVDLAGFEGRDTAQLSGGERQRVALARSLAPNPRLLMLDEPLGSLDVVLRERLIVELRQIIKRVGLTAVYVTHDQHEAFVIADRIALMNAGRVEQIGTPQEVYRKPVSPFAARFLGLNNIIPIISREREIAHTSIGDFPLPVEAESLLIHPDGLQLADSESPDVIRGIVETCVFLGDSFRVELRMTDDRIITFKLPALTPSIPSVGQSIAIRINPDAIVPLKQH